MSPLLNLSDNEEQSYDALPAGRYFANVYEIEERETKGGPQAKLPAGTPLIYVHFQITGRVGEDDGPNEESDYYNRRAFLHMAIPPEDYDAKARKTMGDKIFTFFKAVGVPEDELRSENWEPDLDSFYERELVIQLDRKKNSSDAGGQEFTNNVIGMKSMEEFAATTSADAGGLI